MYKSKEIDYALRGSEEQIDECKSDQSLYGSYFTDEYQTLV